MRSEKGGLRIAAAAVSTGSGAERGRSVLGTLCADHGVRSGRKLFRVWAGQGVRRERRMDIQPSLRQSAARLLERVRVPREPRVHRRLQRLLGRYQGRIGGALRLPGLLNASSYSSSS
jgi:hypothetical protein